MAAAADAAAAAAAAPDRLTVFIEGTANTLAPVTTQIGEFFALVAAHDVTREVSSEIHRSGPTVWKMGFDGCGVSDGLAGTIWAWGLGTVSKAVCKRVASLLDASTRPLHLTLVGLSRGGIGALMVCKRLGALLEKLGVARSRVHVALCLYDPVPGNLIGTVRFLDPLFGRMTTAASVMDVTTSPIDQVLAIYPYEPLPDLAFHAPILPSYPANCAVEEDVTLGCHQGALYPPAVMREHVPALYKSCVLSQHRLLAFLGACGVVLTRGPAESRDLPGECLRICEQELDSAALPPSSRAAHVANGAAAMVRRRNGLLLNRHHRELLEAATPSDPRLERLAASGAAAADEVVERKVDAEARYMLDIVRTPR